MISNDILLYSQIIALLQMEENIETHSQILHRECEILKQPKMKFIHHILPSGFKVPLGKGSRKIVRVRKEMGHQEDKAF